MRHTYHWWSINITRQSVSPYTNASSLIAQSGLGIIALLVALEPPRLDIFQAHSGISRFYSIFPRTALDWCHRMIRIYVLPSSLRSVCCYLLPDLATQMDKLNTTGPKGRFQLSSTYTKLSRHYLGSSEYHPINRQTFLVSSDWIDYVEFELVWTRLGCRGQVACRSFEFSFRRA